MNTKAFTRKTADVLVTRAEERRGADLGPGYDSLCRCMEDDKRSGYDRRVEERIREAQLAHAAKQKREAQAVYRAQESAIRMRANDHGIKSSAYWGD